MHKIILIIFLVFAFSFSSNTSFAQNNVIEGNVYDQTGYIPIPGVKVQTKSGYKTRTDSLGAYRVVIIPKDSLWFTYDNKSTHRYGTDTIANRGQFDLSIYIKGPWDKEWLPPVFIEDTYKQDSIDRRREYASLFNPDVGGLKINKNAHAQGGFGVSVDFDEIVNAFKFAKNKRAKMYQNFIIKDEQYRYVDHRFSELRVKRITGITDKKELEKFRNIYWPDFLKLKAMSDVNLDQYIRICYKHFVKNKPIELLTLPNRRFSAPINAKIDYGL